jgi:hypothetical protein
MERVSDINTDACKRIAYDEQPRMEETGHCQNEKRKARRRDNVDRTDLLYELICKYVVDKLGIAFEMHFFQ